MADEIINEHNKKEYPPMHTAEHILNGTMVKMWGCKRSCKSHVQHTSEIGTFRITSSRYQDGMLRLVFRLG